jgi:hypothetical protein
MTTCKDLIEVIANKITDLSRSSDKISCAFYTDTEIQYSFTRHTSDPRGHIQVKDFSWKHVLMPKEGHLQPHTVRNFQAMVEMFEPRFEPGNIYRLAFFKGDALIDYDSCDTKMFCYKKWKYTEHIADFEIVKREAMKSVWNIIGEMD